MSCGGSVRQQEILAELVSIPETFFHLPGELLMEFSTRDSAYMIKTWGTYLGTPSLRKNKPSE